MGESKIRNFTDLITWQEAHKLALSIYIVTKSFPKEELYVLVVQIRRAAVSITSNLAEGFSRLSKKEKTQFYSIAKGSLTEVYNQVLLAKDLTYISEEEFTKIEHQINLVGKLLTGLLQSTSR